MTTNLHDKMLAAIDAYFSASNEIEAHIAEEQLLDVRDEINKHKGKELLHKLAAKSLTEGLRLDDWPKIGCVNHDCDKCKALAEQPAQQEPDCWAILTPNGSRLVSPDEAKGRKDAYALYTSPQAQPACEPLTPAQKIALAEDWFAEDWAITKAVGMMVEYEMRIAHGITKGNT